MAIRKLRSEVKKIPPKGTLGMNNPTSAKCPWRHKKVLSNIPAGAITQQELKAMQLPGSFYFLL